MPTNTLTACPTCSADISGYATCRDLYNELSYYTLQHSDPEFFIHQYIVDAYAAQHATDNPKPITNAFALIGLYLFAEKKYTGKAVQKAHMALAKNKKTWPQFIPPKERPHITVREVLNTKPGLLRDEAIKQWAESVWDSWKNEHQKIKELIELHS